MATVGAERKVGRGELAPGCPAQVGDDRVWRIQDYQTAKEFLRQTDTRQAGFGIEGVKRFARGMRLAVLYRDGPEHREHRRQTAKYFTPKRVDAAYRDLMNRLADEQCARLTTAEVTIGDVTIPAGAMVDVGVAAANADPEAMGDDPQRVCPGRELADGVPDAVLSFGDGAHRCPGAYIAIQETDIFLSKLFALEGLRMVHEPEVRIRPEIAAYELVGLVVEESG
ncbi:cytochrome P450 [Paractinoplanes globisporus]|uniref:Cytochrome P450 n=1 Tax=Paractinoplanes globisporus TaxID=113565 RepID=A0ABW6WLX4_9ACTN|nr:cytochrome P450 [Actinoplanes globisporus]